MGWTYYTICVMERCSYELAPCALKYYLKVEDLMEVLLEKTSLLYFSSLS